MYRRRELIEFVTELFDRGMTAEQVASDVGVQPVSIARTLQRAGRWDLAARFLNGNLASPVGRVLNRAGFKTYCTRLHKGPPLWVESRGGYALVTLGPGYDPDVITEVLQNNNFRVRRTHTGLRVTR